MGCGFALLFPCLHFASLQSFQKHLLFSWVLFLIFLCITYTLTAFFACAKNAWADFFHLIYCSIYIFFSIFAMLYWHSLWMTKTISFYMYAFRRSVNWPKPLIGTMVWKNFDLIWMSLLASLQWTEMVFLTVNFGTFSLFVSFVIFDLLFPSRFWVFSMNNSSEYPYFS